MAGFFKGWRRKTGVGALVLACVFMGAYLRVLTIEDYMSFPIENQTIAGIGTARRSLVIYQHGRLTDVAQAEPEPIRRKLSTDVSGNLQTDEGLGIPSENGGALPPFQITISCSFPEPVPLVEIPLIVFVVPLTLLSAYLLLVKPRQTNLKNANESALGGV